MEVNHVPQYDDSVNTTGCCARFNPSGWDGQALPFKDKKFVHAKTRSVMHAPINMGKVFARVQEHVQSQGAYDNNDYIVLSKETSAWGVEHFFSVSKDVTGEEMKNLSGDFVTRVFEGPYSNLKVWIEEMKRSVCERESVPNDIYFFYTTCPSCAKAYGKNYVFGVAEF